MKEIYVGFLILCEDRQTERQREREEGKQHSERIKCEKLLFMSVTVKLASFQ